MTKSDTPVALPGPATALSREAAPLIGRYCLVRSLGAGGMGEVYEAVDTTLERSVALKLLAADLVQDRDARQQFLREARAAAQINHPHVVTVHEVDQVGATVYLAMELAEGSLQDLLNAGQPVPWREATRLVAEACAGLAAAHAAGLIHRDLKPGNLLRVGGRVKLADFGLVKRAGTTTTAPGAGIKGTPAFMSPEQCRAEPVDVRSDIYALGATYFALLTGQVPFASGGPFEVMFAHCIQPIPDPGAVVAGLPAACTAIVRRAMAKEPIDRYPTAAALLDALQMLLGEPVASTASAVPLADAGATVSISQVKPVRFRWRGLLALLAVGLFLTGLGMWAWTSWKEPARIAAPAEEILQIPADGLSVPVGRRVRGLAVAPTGSLLAAALLDRGPARPEGALFLWDLATGKQATLERPNERVRAVAFAPQGDSVFVGTGTSEDHGRLYRVDRPTSSEPAWTAARSDLGNYRALALSSDGQRLAALRTFGARQTALELWEPDSLEPVKRSRSWHGYGYVVAFVPGTRTAMAGGDDGALRIWDDNTDQPVVVPSDGAIVGLAFPPGGKQVLVARSDRLEWWDLAGPTKQKEVALGTEALSLAQSPDGRLLAVGCRSAVLLLAAATVSELHRWRRPSGEAWAVSFTRGGGVLAIGIWPDALILRDVRSFYPTANSGQVR